MARRPFVVDPVLTAITVGFRNLASARIADEVLPRGQVSAEKFAWTEYSTAESFNVPDARAQGRSTHDPEGHAVEMLTDRVSMIAPFAVVSVIAALVVCASARTGVMALKTSSRAISALLL